MVVRLHHGCSPPVLRYGAILFTWCWFLVVCQGEVPMFPSLPTVNGTSAALCSGNGSVVYIGGFVGDAASDAMFVMNVQTRPDVPASPYWLPTMQRLPAPIAGPAFAASYDGLSIWMCYAGSALTTVTLDGSCFSIQIIPGDEPGVDPPHAAVQSCRHLQIPRTRAAVAVTRTHIVVLGGIDKNGHVLKSAEFIELSCASPSQVVDIDFTTTGSFAAVVASEAFDLILIYTGDFAVRTLLVRSDPPQLQKYLPDQVLGPAGRVGGAATGVLDLALLPLSFPPYGHLYWSGPGLTLRADALAGDGVPPLLSDHGLVSGWLPSEGQQQAAFGPYSLYGTPHNSFSQLQLLPRVDLPYSVSHGEFKVRQRRELQLLLTGFHHIAAFEAKVSRSMQCAVGHDVSDSANARVVSQTTLPRGSMTTTLAFNTTFRAAASDAFICLNIGVCSPTVLSASLQLAPCAPEDPTSTFSASDCLDMGCCWLNNGSEPQCVARAMSTEPAYRYWYLATPIAISIAPLTRTQTTPLTPTRGGTASGSGTASVSGSRVRTLSRGTATRGATASNFTHSASLSMPTTATGETPTPSLLRGSPSRSSSLSPTRASPSGTATWSRSKADAPSVSASLTRGTETPSSSCSPTRSRGTWSPTPTAAAHVATMTKTMTTPTNESGSPTARPGAMSALAEGIAIMGSLLLLVAVGAVVYHRRRSAKGREHDFAATGFAAAGGISDRGTDDDDDNDAASGGINQFRIVEKIGSGGYGVVYRIERKRDRQQFAMKYIACPEDDDRVLALKEFDMLKKLQGHPNVIMLMDMFMNWEEELVAPHRQQPNEGMGGVAAASSVVSINATSAGGSKTVFGVGLDSSGESTSLLSGGRQMQTFYSAEATALRMLSGAPRYVCLIIEYFPEGDLAKFCSRYHEPLLPEALIIGIAEQVANFLSFIHSRSPPMMHGDLKPENLLLDFAHERVAVTDLGLAVELGAADTHARKAGTMHFMAPEQVSGRPCTKSDIWALGCVLYATCTRHVADGEMRPMFLDIKRPEKVAAIRDDLRPYSAPFVDLIMVMLSIDPAKRPSALDVIRTCFDLKQAAGTGGPRSLSAFAAPKWHRQTASAPAASRAASVLSTRPH